MRWFLLVIGAGYEAIGNIDLVPVIASCGYAYLSEDKFSR
jgi:hypothetical protein